MFRRIMEVSLTCSALVIASAAFWGWLLKIPELSAPIDAFTRWPSHPYAMAPNTAIALILLCIAVLLALERKSR